MDTLTVIRDSHAWLRWLSGRTLDACAALPEADFRREFPIGLGSVHATLVHLVGAERIWIGVLEGDAAVTMPAPAELPDHAAIRRAYADVRRRWDGYLGRLTVQECERVVSRVRDGREYRQSVADALMQVPTHALYHNAQLSFMFRSMGHALPDSSWILWGRERLAAAT
jgi:uncharacterized damage-inducible protein DinB